MSATNVNPETQATSTSTSMTDKAKAVGDSAKALITGKDADVSIKPSHARILFVLAMLATWGATRALTIGSTLTAAERGERPGVLPFTTTPLGINVHDKGFKFVARKKDAPIVQLNITPEALMELQVGATNQLK